MPCGLSLNKAGDFRQLPVRVFNFEQTAAVDWRRLRGNGGDEGKESRNQEAANVKG